MRINEKLPCQILQHEAFFVLPGAVICMQELNILTEPVYLKKIVKTTDYIVCSFATLSCLISKKVHLPWQGLAVHTEHSTLP